LGGFFYCQPWRKAKYTFCCAPINRRMPFVNTMFLKMARQFSRGDVISFDWLCSQVRRSSLGRIRIRIGSLSSGSCLLVWYKIYFLSRVIPSVPEPDPDPTFLDLPDPYLLFRGTVRIRILPIRVKQKY
jgi:hypothetical protein